jgi:signal peptidase I
MDPFGLTSIVPALLLRTFLIQPFTVAAGSMMPTLEVRDHILASKFSYGYSQYSTVLGDALPAFEFAKIPPARGDVVVFAGTNDPSSSFIKRVIGLGGDRIQIKGGITYLNDKPLKRELIGDYEMKSDIYDGIKFRKYRETLPDGRSYAIIDHLDGSSGDDTEIFTVPSGHVFVMGDNRDNSDDSRFSIGYLPVTNIFAKAWMVVDFSGKTVTGREIK